MPGTPEVDDVVIDRSSVGGRPAAEASEGPMPPRIPRAAGNDDRNAGIRRWTGPVHDVEGFGRTEICLADGDVFRPSVRAHRCAEERYLRTE